MPVIKILLLTFQIISGLAIIGLVLLQKGKGSETGAGLGGGASATLFGATGASNFLSRTTAIFATVFFITTLGLTYHDGNKHGKNLNLLAEIKKTAQSNSTTSTNPVNSTNPTNTANPINNIPKN
jgi:preprotein translocase subunit SecG